MKTSDFDYILPQKFIAQEPVSPRDHSKLMVYDSKNDRILHKHFYDLPEFLNKNDVMVVNRSKVIPARIIFTDNDKEREVFILKQLDINTYHVLVRPGRYFKLGKLFNIDKGVHGFVKEILVDGSRIIKFNSNIRKFGKTPLPPYIKNNDVAPKEYQTVYAKEEGSVAAPTAGLHFTPELINKLKSQNVTFLKVLLHVGRGTFLPVSSEDIKNHVMHKEFFELSLKNAQLLNKNKENKKRIIAVGTTSVRVLESSYSSEKGFVPQSAETDIFIYPTKHKWNAVDALITNFHLPKSTLIMLVASFLEHKGVKDPIKKILQLYALAKKKNYRFYSFGDAMFLY